MDDQRRRRDEEADRDNETRRQEAANDYERAQGGLSLERERAALHSLDLETVRSQVERLERRVARLEEELNALRSRS